MEKEWELIRRFLLVASLAVCLAILSATMLSKEQANAQEPTGPTPSATPTLQLTGAGLLEVAFPASPSNIPASALSSVDCNIMSPPVVGYEISKGQDSNDITAFTNDLGTNGFSLGTVDISAGPIPSCVDILIVEALAQNLPLSSSYSPAEGTLLKAWTASGRGLMVSGDWGIVGAGTEALFQAYGYSQQGSSGVTDSTDFDPAGPSNTWVIYQTDNFSSHPILNGVASLELLTSSWLSPTTNAVVTTDVDAVPPGEPVMAAFIDGSGCVALSTDSNWNMTVGTVDGYSKEENAKVARQMVQWLNSCTQLTLTKIAAPNPVAAGQILTYTLTVTNNSVSSVTSVRITDTIPANTNFVAATDPHNGPDVNGVITWPLGTLNFNASAVVTMTVQVNNSTPSGTIINNTAWVTSNEGLTGTATAMVNVVASQLVTATGLVWQDTDGDATYDVGLEPILPNITVVVTDSLGIVHTLATDVSGWYRAIVPIGTVIIDVDQADLDLPANSILTTANDPTSVTISAGSSGGADFGFQPHGLVTGLVWQDIDGDATYDVGLEPVLPNITVVVTDSLGAPHILVTDVSGRYTTTVPIGTVTIDVDQADPDLPANSILTTANDPASVTISAGSSGGADFGFQPRSTVTGVVWQDLNGNGIIDGLEPGLSNITVVITDSLGSAQILITDANGHYTANIPSGVVTIDIDQSDPDLSPNSTLTTANDPTTVTISAGGTGGTNFGFQSPATVTGLVWRDQNGNGNIDMLEPMLPNITVIITKNNGVSEPLVTDSNGRYSTTVPSGTVTIDVDQTDPDLPANSVLTTANDPLIVMVPDGGFAGTHFGFRQSPTPTPPSVPPLPPPPPPSAPPSDHDDDDDNNHDDTVIVPPATPVSSIASNSEPEPTVSLPVAFLPDTGSREVQVTANRFVSAPSILTLILIIAVLFGFVFVRTVRRRRIN